MEHKELFFMLSVLMVLMRQMSALTVILGMTFLVVLYGIRLVKAQLHEN